MEAELCGIVGVFVISTFSAFDCGIYRMYSVHRRLELQQSVWEMIEITDYVIYPAKTLNVVCFQ